MGAPDPDNLQVFCLHNPDSPVCDHVPNFYDYRIDLAANAAFLAIFAASLLGYAVTLAVTRRGVAFGVALMLGLVCEIIGYAGRIMSWQNPWDENGFLMQICCLTIGPAFMAASIYLCLRRIVSAFGPENSRIPPEYYTRIFIPCDVVSLILQATGGGMAAVAFHGNGSAATGTHIMVAGLSFQVATIVAFIVASLDFALRTRRASASALASDPALVRMRGTRRFKGFLAALALSTFCILWRSAFRVAELSEGWGGPVIAKQGLFIGFEGVLVVVAVLALNLFHPAFCAPELFSSGGGLKGLWFFRRKSQGGGGEKSQGGGEKTAERNGDNQGIRDSSDSA